MKDEPSNGTTRLPEELAPLGEPEFAEEWKEIPIVVESYYPTRLEYLAGKALQGLCTRRSEKFLRNVPRLALLLAQEMEVALDKAQD